MTMGFKYQILACSHPAELLDITINHLCAPSPIPYPPTRPADDRIAVLANRMTVISMVQDQAAIDSVQKAIESVTACYSTCTPTDFALLRQTLAAHFQDKKVKVSLFLQGDSRTPPPASRFPTPSRPAVSLTFPSLSFLGVWCWEHPVLERCCSAFPHVPRCRSQTESSATTALSSSTRAARPLQTSKRRARFDTRMGRSRSWMCPPGRTQPRAGQ